MKHLNFTMAPMTDVLSQYGIFAMAPMAGMVLWHNKSNYIMSCSIYILIT